jgi:hypothetical protein
MIKQHTKPCSACPFRRKSLPGFIGGAEPQDFQRMAQSEARMPCHSHIRGAFDYQEAQDPSTRFGKAPQCAGRAIHWANQLKTARIPGRLLELPRDTVTVFEWPSEWIAHHEGGMEAFLMSERESES